MNDEFKPYPPLDLIEERLFAGPPTGTQEPHVETPREDALPPVGLSPWLRDRIAQVARTRSVPIPPVAQAGQIWSVAYRGERGGIEVGGRIPMLLDRPGEAGGWQGWLVSADPDYASRADVIIDTRELGIAPAACMVQTWNRVEAVRDDAAPYLGQLDPDMLAAVRAVAAESPAARPEEGVAGNARAARSRRGRIRPHRPRPGAGPGSALGLPAPLLRIIGHASRVGTRP